MRRSGWTPERRVKQAEAVRRWKPWEKSTGPRTEAGKARSSQNADKGIAALDARMLQVRLKWRAAREAELDNAYLILCDMRQ